MSDHLTRHAVWTPEDFSFPLAPAAPATAAAQRAAIAWAVQRTLHLRAAQAQARTGGMHAQRAALLAAVEAEKNVARMMADYAGLDYDDEPTRQTLARAYRALAREWQNGTEQTITEIFTEVLGC